MDTNEQKSNHVKKNNFRYKKIVLLILVLPIIVSIAYTTWNQFMPPIHEMGDIGDPIKGNGNFVCSNFGTRSHGFIEEIHCSFIDVTKEVFELALPFYSVPLVGPISLLFNQHILIYIYTLSSWVALIIFIILKKKQYTKKTTLILHLLLYIFLTLYIMISLFLLIDTLGIFYF